MKQIIKLEIHNSTGVEFEEMAKLGKPSDTDWFLFDGEIMKAKNCLGIYPILTPKLDRELEKAKKKFPVGSYYTTTNRMSGVFAQVESVEIYQFSPKDTPKIHIFTGGSGSLIETCTPFPLPVWRCCETDKPKKDGRYAIRYKSAHKSYNSAVFHYDSWDISNTKNYEWLDEGEI